MIPSFDERGFLPPGVHRSDWGEFVERYGISDHRRKLIGLLEGLIRHMKAVGCRSMFIDGSFVTNKERPNDYDACWDVHGVKVERIDPVLMNFTDFGKARMEEKYGGDIRPDAFSPTETAGTYLEFFQIDRNGDPKGIVQLVLAEIEI